MDIPCHDREEIRFNYVKFSSRGEQVLLLFNDSQSFDRHILEKCFNELKRKDLKDILLPMVKEVFLLTIFLRFCHVTTRLEFNINDYLNVI